VGSDCVDMAGSDAIGVFNGTVTGAAGAAELLSVALAGTGLPGILGMYKAPVWPQPASRPVTRTDMPI